jgi:hypothetical protein
MCLLAGTTILKFTDVLRSLQENRLLRLGGSEVNLFGGRIYSYRTLFRSVAILSDFSNSSRAFPYHGALAGNPLATDREIFAKELEFASLAENSNMWGVGGRDVSQP